MTKLEESKAFVDNTKIKSANLEDMFLFYVCGFQYYLDGENGRKPLCAFGVVREVEISKMFAEAITPSSPWFRRCIFFYIRYRLCTVHKKTHVRLLVIVTVRFGPEISHFNVPG